LGRTVIQTDNSWFTLLTQNTSPVHFDVHYAAQTEFGKPLVDSTFTLALVTGQSVVDVSQHVFANLGWDRVRCPNPLFEGDTVYSQSEVLSVRESKSRPDVGIVTVRTVGYTAEGKIVITFERTFMVYRRGHGPQFADVEPPPARCHAVPPCWMTSHKVRRTPSSGRTRCRCWRASRNRRDRDRARRHTHRSGPTQHSRDPCGICCHHTVLGCHIPCEARRIGCSH
jgi:itaconyl-CoA hydratase